MPRDLKYIFPSGIIMQQIQASLPSSVENELLKMSFLSHHRPFDTVESSLLSTKRQQKGGSIDRVYMSGYKNVAIFARCHNSSNYDAM
jgi:hypothetical protein